MGAAAEGTVDWKAAEAYMQRGEGADAGAAEGDGTAAESPSEPREFKYRGKTLTVDPDTHAVLEDLRREARGANGKLGSELAKARERLARLEGVVSASAPTAEPARSKLKPPDPTLATRDIAAWQEQLDAYHQAQMAEMREQLEEKYVRVITTADTQLKEQQREQQWADGFYSANDYLDHPEIKPIVGMVYIENKSEIDLLRESSAEEAYDRLAELSDARLVSLRNAGKGAEPTTNTSRRPPRLESTAGPVPRGKQEAPAREFSAASWVARQRLKMNGRTAKE